MNLQYWQRKLWAFPGLRGGGGGTSQDFEGSALLANAARALWADTKADIWPVENTLLASTKGATLPGALAQSNAAVARAFDTQQRGTALDLARRGVTPTAEQTQAMQRNSSLQKAATFTSSQNLARRAVRERDMSTITGSAGTGLQVPKPMG